MNLGAGRRTQNQMDQIANDQVLAKPLQEQFIHEHSPALARGVSDKPDHDGELAAYAKRLQSVRCIKCKTPIKVDGNTLIQHTTKMLKKSSRTIFTCVTWMAGTDNPRLSASMLSLPQVQGMVLRRRRHVQ
jgi:hypothetical protein